MSLSRPGSPIVASPSREAQHIRGLIISASSSDDDSLSDEQSLSTTEVMDFPPTPPSSPATVNLTDSTDAVQTVVYSETPISQNVISDYVTTTHQLIKDFEYLTMTRHPIKSRPLNWLTFFPEKHTNIKAFHVVDYAEHHNKPVFLKHNAPGSIMSELEAVNWGHYELIAPEMVPACTRAHYNSDGDYVAVSSRAIPGFKSTLEDPLTEADLNNPDIIKGLAIGITISYLFKEDDLHRGNMSKYGKRIDFDMSLWPILARHKASNFADYIFRVRSENDYRFTERDILQFPNIMDAQPFYWPTKPQPIIPESVRSTLSMLFPVSQNAFAYNENELYKRLANHPTFIFYKFQTMLKYILTTPTMYEGVIRQHMRKDHYQDNRNLIDLLVEYQDRCIAELKAILINMPEFQKFIYENGKNAFDNIKLSFEERNKNIDMKIQRTQENDPENIKKLKRLTALKVDIEEIQKAYAPLARECQRRALLNQQRPSARRGITQTL